MSQKLWGGRFAKGTDQAVEEFTSSLGIDVRLWTADVRASIAHARMLGAAGIVPKAESAQLVQGLECLLKEHASAGLAVAPTDEDVHSAIERLLGEKLGPLAGKLHTGRSRNDQVITATRLCLREELDDLLAEIRAFQELIVKTAEPHLETILPGLTHMQHAQPVSLAHHLLAYFWMLERDHGRLADLRERLNTLPLGSAALAGTGFPLDRQAVAKELGFAKVSENSLDSVSDRDFIVEFLSAGALIMNHLSRLSEELILWSMPEFGFVELDDSVTTGSSIMPQKKNPDVAELIRGRVGRLNGALVGLLTTLKALPLAYNRDLQEDKYYLFDALDTVRSCVRLSQLMLDRADFRPARMKAALRGDFSNATELADELARKGMAFRQAHEVVGKIVRHCLEKKRALEDLTLEELRQFSPDFDAKTLEAVQHLSALKARVSEGGTAPKAVREQIAKARAILRQS